MPLHRHQVVESLELDVAPTDRGCFRNCQSGILERFVAVTLHAMEKTQDAQDLGSDLAPVRRKANRLLG
jgi:hypothetical protein